MNSVLAKFSYAGFNCEIIERPDMFYLRQVRGFRESDKKLFGCNSPILFDRDLTLGAIRDACISMIDNKFSGNVEVYGDLAVVV